MKIYGISGLGADKRVFEYLNLDCELIPIDWIDPFENEKIEDYAMRLAQSIDQSEKFILLGVSFGGIIAAEISKRINPELTILISAPETKKDLRLIYKGIGKTKILDILPSQFFKLPKGLAHLLFGTDRKELLNQILDDTDLKFAKWAIKELVNWQNEDKLCNCIKINGSKDKLIPPSEDLDNIMIENGEHFMIVDKAEEISRIINKQLEKFWY